MSKELVCSYCHWNGFVDLDSDECPHCHEQMTLVPIEELRTDDPDVESVLQVVSELNDDEPKE